MPVRVRIDINGRDITTFHIGRWEGEAVADSVNAYFVVEQEAHPTNAEWLAGKEITHRYGRGLVALVGRALAEYDGLAVEPEAEDENGKA